MVTPEEKQRDPQSLRRQAVEPVPADKLKLFDGKTRSLSPVEKATKEAGKLMRKIMAEEGRFAFCVRADTGHVLIGYTDDGHDEIMSEHEVPDKEKKLWSVGGVMDGRNVEYANLAQVPGLTKAQVFKKSNAALLAAGLDPKLEITTPKALEDKKTKTKLQTRGLTPKGMQIPISDRAGISCVWEDGYCYTKWTIAGLGQHGREGTRLNHDRLTRQLESSYEVFRTVERGSEGDRGVYLEATYQNVCDNRDGTPPYQVSAGGTYTTGYMVTRAKSSDRKIPEVYRRLQAAFKRDNVNVGD